MAVGSLSREKGALWLLLPAPPSGMVTDSLLAKVAPENDPEDRGTIGTVSNHHNYLAYNRGMLQFKSLYLVAAFDVPLNAAQKLWPPGNLH